MYCIINENFGIVARIDRSDWKEYMAKHIFTNVEVGLDFMSFHDDAQLADIYRFVEKDEFALLRKQYKQDCEDYAEPWKLWQVRNKGSKDDFIQCSIPLMFLSSNEYRRITIYFVLVGDIVYEYVYENNTWDNEWFDKGVASFDLQELKEKYNYMLNKVKKSVKHSITSRVLL